MPNSLLEKVYVEGEEYGVTFSFDIDDFIGDGVWGLQIYDSNRNLLYDKPFASSRGILDKDKLRKIIKEEFLSEG